ncbi:PHP domain-containing protein [Candidatus Latescibacterota bacterium]
MRTFYADLHIHTCLSPCAENDMSPPVVVEQAHASGLDIIAVCDHNSADNVGAVIGAAEDSGLSVIGGMEITSSEEVHILGLFRDIALLGKAQEVVYDNLPGENNPDYFGEQLLADKYGNITGNINRLLIGATVLSLEEIVCMIHEFGGIAIASHIDRPSFSVISQLGFIPEVLELDGVEIHSGKLEGLPENMPIVFSSDAHRPEDIGNRRTRFHIEVGTLDEIRLALRNKGCREIHSGQ